jgi:thioredoxin 2
MPESHSESYHVVCPHCATTNRIPAAKPAHEAKCGNCGKPVFDGHPVALDAKAFQRQVAKSDIPGVVDFWAEWCGPCKMMAPEFARAAHDMEPRARFAKVDTEVEQGIAAQFGIRSIPTLVIFKGGREIARQSGAMPASQLKSWVGQYV